MSNLIDRKEHGQMTMLQQAKGEVSEEENKGSNTKNIILGNAKKRDKSNIPPPTPTENGKNKTEENSDVNSDAPTNYKEMLKRFLKEKIAGKGLTPEQREKRDMRLAKISDGISAIANLVATTQGAANSYTGQNTRTENTRKKWEEFYNKREQEKRQIYEDKMRALKLEEAIRNRDKAIEEEEKPTSRSPIQRESEFIEQKQNNTNDAPTTKGSYTSNDVNIPQNVSANSQQKTSSNTQNEVKNNILAKNSKAQKEDKKGSRNNNKIGFIDDSGNEIAINKDVWRGSMQQIFNILIDEGIGKESYQDQERYKKRMSELSNSQKEDFVKLNWNKSNRAKSQMLNLAEKDPNKYKSKISDSEEIEDYYPGSKAEIIDYVPGKK